MLFCHLPSIFHLEYYYLDTRPDLSDSSITVIFAVNFIQQTMSGKSNASNSLFSTRTSYMHCIRTHQLICTDIQNLHGHCVHDACFLFFPSVISMRFSSNFQITTLRHASKTNKPRLVLCLRRTSAASCKENCVFLSRINKTLLRTLVSDCIGFNLFCMYCFIQ